MARKIEDTNFGKAQLEVMSDQSEDVCNQPRHLDLTMPQTESDAHKKIKYSWSIMSSGSKYLTTFLWWQKQS